LRRYVSDQLLESVGCALVGVEAQQHAIALQAIMQRIDIGIHGAPAGDAQGGALTNSTTVRADQEPVPMEPDRRSPRRRI
jgi:hypothetical protein